MAGQTDREVADVDHFLDFALTLGFDLAHLERDQRAECLFLFSQLVAELTNDFATMRRGDLSPHEEGSLRAIHDDVVLRLGDLSDAGDTLAVDGARDVENGP
jgi:hypothetical protein